MRALDPEVNDIVWQAIEPLFRSRSTRTRSGGTDCRYCGHNGKLRATMAVERTEPSVATRTEDEEESAVPAGADRPPTSEEEEAGCSPGAGQGNRRARSPAWPRSELMKSRCGP